MNLQEVSAAFPIGAGVTYRGRRNIIRGTVIGYMAGSVLDDHARPVIRTDEGARFIPMPYAPLKVVTKDDLDTDEWRVVPPSIESLRIGWPRGTKGEREDAPDAIVVDHLIDPEDGPVLRLYIPDTREFGSGYYREIQGSDITNFKVVSGPYHQAAKVIDAWGALSSALADFYEEMDGGTTGAMAWEASFARWLITEYDGVGQDGHTLIQKANLMLAGLDSEE